MRNLASRACESIADFIRYIGMIVLYAVTIAGLFLILFDLGHYIFYSSDFIVKEITTNHTEWVDHQIILSRAAIPPGTNIWMVDVNKIRTSLENHPMIRHAFVQRVPPHRIHIELQERIPVAYVFDATPSVMYGIDREGVILPPVTPEDFEEFTNVTGNKYIQLIQSCPLLSGNFDLSFELGVQEDNYKVQSALARCSS